MAHSNCCISKFQCLSAMKCIAIPVFHLFFAYAAARTTECTAAIANNYNLANWGYKEKQHNAAECAKVAYFDMCAVRTLRKMVNSPPSLTDPSSLSKPMSECGVPSSGDYALQHP